MASAGDHTHILSQRADCTTVTAGPLDSVEARALLVHTLKASYGKVLDDRHVAVLLAKAGATSPLRQRVALARLHVLDRGGAATRWVRVVAGSIHPDNVLSSMPLNVPCTLLRAVAHACAASLREGQHLARLPRETPCGAQCVVNCCATCGSLAMPIHYTVRISSACTLHCASTCVAPPIPCEVL